MRAETFSVIKAEADELPKPRSQTGKYSYE